MNMIRFCKDLDEKIQPQDLLDLSPNCSPAGSGSDSTSTSFLPISSADGFPTIEVVDASLDFFFQCSPLPFLHKPTFNARAFPSSLLLPVVLIGLSSLYPERSKIFVLGYLKVSGPGPPCCYLLLNLLSV
jgi:hypothetical protein